MPSSEVHIATAEGESVAGARKEQSEMNNEDNGKSRTNCIAKEASPIESEIHPSHKPDGSYSVYFASRGGTNEYKALRKRG